MTHGASSNQNAPLKGQRKVLDRVLEDLEQRAEAGKKKYGTYLETHNGRDALLDAYQEALDLCMYLGHLIMENETRGSD